MTLFPLDPASEQPLYEEDLDPDPVSESQAGPRETAESSTSRLSST